MPPRTPRSRCWTRCRTRRRSACGSTAARCRAGRSAQPAATPSSCCRWGRVDRNRAQAEQQIRSFRGRGRTPIAYALEQAATDLGTRLSARSCSSPTARTPASRPRRASVAQRGLQGRRRDADPGDRLQRRPRGARGTRVHRQRGRRRLPRRRPTRRACGRSCGSLSTRALRQYEPKGKPIKGGPSARQATLITPGQYTDQMLPDTERWYAVELKRGETLKASQSFIPPTATLDDSVGASSHLDIVTPSFDIPGAQNSSAGNDTLFARRGFVAGSASSRDRSASAGRPPRTRRSPSRGATTSSSRSRTAPTRRSSTRPAGSRTRRRCRSRSSAAVARRSSRRQPTKTEAVGHARRAAERAAAGRRRRRAGRGSASRGGALTAVETARMRPSPSPAAALLVAAGRRPRPAGHARRRRRLVQHRAAAQARPLRRHGRGRRDRVLEGRHAQGPGPARPRHGRHLARSRPTSPPTTTSRAWTTSTTTWIS